MSGRRKHVPRRSCVVCKTVVSKRDLIRLVRTPDGQIEIDLTGKTPGRGAYLCDNSECWAQAASTDVLAKALRTELSQDVREMIGNYRL